MIFLTFVMMLRTLQRKNVDFAYVGYAISTFWVFVVHKCHRLMPFMHVLSGKFMLRDGLDFVL